MTNKLTNRVNELSHNIRAIDDTLISWAKFLNKFFKRKDCETSANLEFMSHFAAHTSRLFNSVLRFVEVQDVVTQFAHLKDRALIGFGDLPQSVINAVSARFDQIPELHYTTQVLKDGFPLLINPTTEYLKTDKTISLNTFATLPRLTSENSLCTIENLVSLVYKIKDTCFSGPLSSNNYALVSCKNRQMIIKADLLTACYSRPNAVICPETILKDANDTSWIGIPWTHGTQLNFDRTHVKVPCTNFHSIYHLGGRYYLSTMQQNIELSTGKLLMMPLSIYHIPCNETNPILKTGFGNCPSTLRMSVPIFQKSTVTYIPWVVPSNHSAIQLSYKSMDISPPLKFNKSIIKALDDTFTRLDAQLHRKIKKVYEEIDSIKETQETETALIIAAVAVSLAGLNTIFLITFCCFYNKMAKVLGTNDLCTPKPDPSKVVYTSDDDADDCKDCAEIRLASQSQDQSTDA